MACYGTAFVLVKPDRVGSPGYRPKYFGSRYFSNADIARFGQPFRVPCSQCIGCRLERSRQWAVRLVKELKSHERSCFLTLTYSDKFLARTRSGLPTLHKEDFTLFMKRLRKYYPPKSLRFFQCGEYGERTQRPHHHAIIFGTDFVERMLPDGEFVADRFQVEDSRSGFPQFESKFLNKIWRHGRVVISEVSFESAAYVARYCVKKVTGKGADFHYQGRVPEYVTMSRKPGIAAGFFEEYSGDIYPFDAVVPDIGRPASLPPRYFDRLLEKVDPALFARVKEKRMGAVDFFSDPDSTDARLATRERLKELILKKCLPRGVE